MKILISHPGEVLEREHFFCEVWQTAYISDTRTLGVHIIMLRKKLREDSRNPRFLKTIRSVGYRIDL